MSLDTEIDFDSLEEEWYTLEDIEITETEEELYCLAVDSEDSQFLAGKIGVPTHNTDEGKAEDALKGEAAMIIGSIARLGRAAGVHLVIATQRPDASIISGETKANLGVRINCGRTDSNASNMILGTGDGTRVKANPRGRLYLRIYGNGDHGQGFFASPSWIDEYLASKGLNPDGTPISQPRSRLAKIADMSEFEEADLDTREGVDNASAIEKIRQEEASGIYESSGSDDSESEEIDFDWDTDEDEEEEENDSSNIPENSGQGETKGFAKLEFAKKDGDAKDKFHRPEEDFDNDLAELIKENNEYFND